MNIFKWLKRIVIFIRYAANNFFKQYIILPVGLAYCRLKFGNNNVTYIVVCDHIGDTVFTLGYIKAFREEKHIQSLAFVTTRHLLELTKLYPDVIDYPIAISKYCLHMILKGQQTPLGILLYRHIKNVIIVEPANHIVEGFDFICKFPQVQLIDFIRYGIFGLDKTSQYMLPACEKEFHILEENTLKIILCQSAQVTDALLPEFFKNLAGILLSNGYDVYTNVSGAREQIISGTKKFACKLTEISFKVQTEKLCFIGLRSGLLDLVQHMGGSVLALYPIDSQMTHFFAIGQGVIQTKNSAQYVITGDIKQDLDNILICLKSICA